MPDVETSALVGPKEKSSNLQLSFFSYSSIDQAESLHNYLAIINYIKRGSAHRGRDIFVKLENVDARNRS